MYDIEGKYGCEVGLSLSFEIFQNIVLATLNKKRGLKLTNFYWMRIFNENVGSVRSIKIYSEYDF